MAAVIEMIENKVAESTGRSFNNLSTIAEIIDRKSIIKMVEENPEVVNLIQCLNSENQENVGKRNGIEDDEEKN